MLGAGERVVEATGVPTHDGSDWAIVRDLSAFIDAVGKHRNWGPRYRHAARLTGKAGKWFYRAVKAVRDRQARSAYERTGSGRSAASPVR